MKGTFITFEGPDGSGKTTQLRLLADYLTKEGYQITTTREPGGTNIGNKIREVLLDPNHKELKDQTEILLYAASRAQLVHELILPELQKGKIVLCDRYIDASIAYQAFGLGINRKIVEQINQFASSALQPDRTYLLSVIPEVSQQRLISRKMLDRIEQKNIEYHRKVYEGFNTLASEQADRILKIDANQSIENIFKLIKNDMDSLIMKKGGMLS